MEQTVYLIRHGHTEGTENRMMYGATELSLTDEGIREISEVAASGVYPDPAGALVYTSGMIRTEQTLRAMYGKDIPHEIAPDLREINVGIYEMKSISEILSEEFGRAWLTGELKDPHFEGGESFSGFNARVTSGMNRIVREAYENGRERIIAVTHGGVIANIMDNWFHGIYDDVWSWTPAPAYGYAVKFKDGRPSEWSLLESGNL